VLCLLLGPAGLLLDMPPEYSGLNSSDELSAARALLAVGPRTRAPSPSGAWEELLMPSLEFCPRTNESVNQREAPSLWLRGADGGNRVARSGVGSYSYSPWLWSASRWKRSKMPRLTLEVVEASGSRRPNARHRFWRRVSVVVIIGVVAFLVVGFWPYLPVPISGQVWTYDHYCPAGTYCTAAPNVTESLPAGQGVPVRWADESGGIAEFNIWGPGWPLNGWVPQCSGNSSSGGCAFSSRGGNYLFQTEDSGSEGPQLVNFTLSYYVSLL
jgi:hypothetical protein